MKFTRKTSGGAALASMSTGWSEKLIRAQRDYVAAVKTHQESSEAVAKKGNEETWMREMHDEKARDEAYGYFARLAHAEGGRACLCGKIEQEPAEPRATGDAVIRSLAAHQIAKLSALASVIFEVENLQSTALDRALRLLRSLSNAPREDELAEARRFLD